MRRSVYPFHLEPPGGDFVKYLSQLERQSGHVNLMRMPRLDWQSLKKSPSFSDVAVPQAVNWDAERFERDITLPLPKTQKESVLNSAWGKTSTRTPTVSPATREARHPEQRPTNPFGIDPGLLIFIGVALMMFSVFGAVVLFGEETDNLNYYTPCFFGFVIGAFLVWSQQGEEN